MTSVLIVDDHPSFRASARAILEAEGFDVIGEVDDGASALAAAGTLRPAQRSPCCARMRERSFALVPPARRS